MPGPFQYSAAPSFDRYSCNMANEDVFPLPHSISGIGLIEGNNNLLAACLHSSCKMILNSSLVGNNLGNLKSANNDV